MLVNLGKGIAEGLDGKLGKALSSTIGINGRLDGGEGGTGAGPTASGDRCGVDRAASGLHLVFRLFCSTQNWALEFE